jgi:hypothetical protein
VEHIQMELPLFTNNTGGTFNVTGLSTEISTNNTFTGGTVTGANAHLGHFVLLRIQYQQQLILIYQLILE